MPNLTKDVKVEINWGQSTITSGNTTAETDVTDRVENYSIQYGANVSQDTEYPAVDSASGYITLRNVDGRYTPGTTNSITGNNLEKRSVIRFTIEDLSAKYFGGLSTLTTPTVTSVSSTDYILFEGYVYSPRMISEDFVQLQIEGKLARALERVNRFYYSGTALNTIRMNVRDTIGAVIATPRDIPVFPLPSLNVGVINETLTIGQFLNRLNIWSGTYIHETHLGGLNFVDPVEANKYHSSMHVRNSPENAAIFESMDPKPMFKHIKNDAESVINSTAADDDESIIRVYAGISLPASTTLSFDVEPTDNNIISVSWSNVSKDDMDATETITKSNIVVTQINRTRSMRLSIRNNGTALTNFSFLVKGTATRVVFGQSIDDSDSTSIASFDKQTAENLPEWWSSETDLETWINKFKDLKYINKVQMTLLQPDGSISQYQYTFHHSELATIQPGYTIRLNLIDRDRYFHKKVLVLGCQLEYRRGRNVRKSITAIELQDISAPVVPVRKLSLTDIGNVTYIVGQTVNITLPSATANVGNPYITYNLSPALPAGLSRVGRTISGIPTTATAPTTYTFTANAKDYVSASKTFTIGINGKALSLPLLTNKSFVKGVNITAFILPTATANTGNPIVTYTLTNLPAGLSFNSSNRVVSGNPTGTGTSTVTYTANAVGYTPATETFTIEIIQSTLSLSTISNKSYDFNAPVSITLPTATANVGNPSVTYTVTGLPSGLSFNASTRVISGTASTSGTHMITYSASATNYTSASTTFNIVVTEDVRLTLPTINSRSFATNANVNFTLPVATASSGSPTITYTVTGLPSGLSFNASTRVISGTVSSRGTHTITYSATSSGYISDSETFNLFFGNILIFPSISNKNVVPGSTVNITLPAATSSMGTPTITYSVTGLPSGLSFNASTRVISGTASSTESVAFIHYTATAANHDNAFTTFYIGITTSGKYLYISGNVSKFFTSGTPITPFVMPEAGATTGSPTITYTIANLPPGLSFDTATRQVTGTPTGSWFTNTTYTASSSGYLSVTRTYGIYSF